MSTTLLSIDTPEDVAIQNLHDQVTEGLRLAGLEDNYPNRMDMFQVKYDMLMTLPVTPEREMTRELMNTIMTHTLLHMQEAHILMNRKPFKP